MDIFSSASMATSPMTRNTPLVQDDCRIPNRTGTYLPLVSGAHMNKLFIIKAKILEVLKY